MVKRHLVAEGVHVQSNCIRKAIHDIVPSLTTRKRPLINRRVYYVPCPNYLWPIDGNHKWFDGALWYTMDGFSRLVTFCRCSDNNKTVTVFCSFKRLCQNMGDQFVSEQIMGEKILIFGGTWQHSGETMPVQWLLEVPYTTKESSATIEHEEVVAVSKPEFFQLERQDILGSLNGTHLFCLHYVYLPRINKAFLEFVVHIITTRCKLRQMTHLPNCSGQISI